LSGILDESNSCSFSIVKELHLERETISEVGKVSKNKNVVRFYLIKIGLL